MGARAGQESNHNNYLCTYLLGRIEKFVIEKFNYSLLNYMNEISNNKFLLYKKMHIQLKNKKQNKHYLQHV